MVDLTRFPSVTMTAIWQILSPNQVESPVVSTSKKAKRAFEISIMPPILPCRSHSPRRGEGRKEIIKLRDLRSFAVQKVLKV